MDACFNEISDLMDSIRITKGTNEKKALIVAWMKSTTAEDEDFGTMVQYLTGEPFKAIANMKLGVSNMILTEAVSMAYEITLDTLNPLIKEIGHIGIAASIQANAGGPMGNYPYRQEPGKLTVRSLGTHFLALIDIKGKDSIQGKVELIVGLLQRSSPNEAMYICSLILEKFPPGVDIGEGLVLDAISEAFGVNRATTERKYVLCGSIGLVAGLARIAGTEGLREIRVVVGQPIMPMLALSMKEAKCKGIEAMMLKHKGYSFAQFKYDGIRCQIHKKGEQVWLFSRNLEDKTAQFPEVVDAVKYVFAGLDVIVDSELVVIDPKTKRVLPFQYISQRVQRTKDVDEYAKTLPATAKLFDVLWTTIDPNIMLKPQNQRTLMLQGLVTKPNTRCNLAESIVAADPLIVDDFMQLSILQGNEGLILKDRSAPYDLSINRGPAWIKYKLVLEPLDLKILDVTIGQGRMAGLIGSVQLGTIEDVSLGSVGGGFSDAMRKDLTERWKMGERDMILTVIYEEIQRGKDGGYGLRFPRVVSMRNDKQADTIERVTNIAEGQQRHA